MSAGREANEDTPLLFESSLPSYAGMADRCDHKAGIVPTPQP